MSDRIDRLMTAPLVQGSGRTDDENCSIELIGVLIYGTRKYGYHLPCLDDGAQAAVWVAQDRLSDEARWSERWRLLLCRLVTCHNTHDERVMRRMALWAARSVEHLADDPAVKTSNDTLERWLAGEATDEEMQAAAAWATAAWAAAWAAARAATAGAFDTDAALMDWVERYLDAWHKVAADEGCILRDDAEEEYLAFVDEMQAALGEVEP